MLGKSNIDKKWLRRYNNIIINDYLKNSKKYSYIIFYIHVN